MQRKRYEAAGLNPALMYGSGSGGGISASLGSVSGGSAGGSVDRRDMSAIGIDPLMLANLENTAAQARKTNAEAENLEKLNAGGYADLQLGVLRGQQDLIGAKVLTEGTQQALMELDRQFQAATFDTRVKLSQSELKEADARVALLIQEYEQNEKLNPLQLQLLEKQVAYYEAQTLLAAMQRYAAQQDAELTKAQKQRIETLTPYEVSEAVGRMLEADSRARLNDANAAVARAEAAEIPKDAKMRRITGYTEMVVGSICDVGALVVDAATFGLSRATASRAARQSDRDYMQRERHHRNNMSGYLRY